MIRHFGQWWSRMLLHACIATIEIDRHLPNCVYWILHMAQSSLVGSPAMLFTQPCIYKTGETKQDCLEITTHYI